MSTSLRPPTLTAPADVMVGAVALALVLVGLSALLPVSASADSRKCGSLHPNYSVRVVKGEVACRNARNVLDDFADNIAQGDCDNPPGCADASPRHWKCRNVRPDRPGEYPGRVLECRKLGKRAKVVLVYTGPPITGERAFALVLAGPTQARPDYQRCPTGSSLKGKLLAAHVGCPAAQRVSLDYFGHTPPGQHVGPARVGRWRCHGSWDGEAFHIKCRRRLPGPGTRHTKFVGVAS